MATIEITAENFQETIENNDIVLMDFGADWCGPCKIFGPVFEAVSVKNEDMVFGKCNTDQQGELASHLQIMSIPTLMVFRGKVLVFRQAGTLPEQALEDLISKVKELDMEEVRAQIAEVEAKEQAEGGEQSDT